jgi:hypothetical protein
MKKLILSLLLTFFITSFTFSDSTRTIVGPGTYFHHVFKPVGPFNITILEVDLTNPYIRVETELAKNILGTGFERTTSMAQRNEVPGRTILGAINGDYFGISQPSIPYSFLGNSMIKNHYVVQASPNNQRSSFAMLPMNKPAIQILSFTGSLRAKNNSVFNINSVNREMANNNLIVYNRFLGATSRTDTTAYEIRVNPIDPYAVNSPMRCVVNLVSGAGNMPIGNENLVLSGTGTAATFLANNFSVGDTVTVTLGSAVNIGNIANLMGGGPRLIVDGNIPENFDGFEGFGGTHVTARHPRTAIGFNQDSTKLYMLVVDGRQALLSVGMNAMELATYMKSIGCYNAFNLDGGGSSTMVVRHQIKNSPSDGSERSVGNALLLISTAPRGALNQLHITPTSPRIFIGKTVQFDVQGTDQYLNPYPLHTDTLKYLLSKPSLGSITNNGLFTASQTADSGSVIISYGSVSTSIPIVVKGISHIDLTPGTAVTDHQRFIQFNAKLIDTDGEEQPLSAIQYSWRSSDTLVGNVDVAGQFKGRNAGTTYVSATYRDFRDSSLVEVQIGEGIAIIDSVESLNGWSFRSENIDSTLSGISFSTEYSTIGSGSIKIDYTFTYTVGQFNWVYLDRNLPLYGLPDSIKIDFRSNGAVHRVFIDVEDGSGVTYRLNTHKIANVANVFESLRSKIPTATGVVFPVRIKSIVIALGSGQVAGNIYSGSVYLDNINIKYPPGPVSVNEEIELSGYQLEQNYPNPFNPSTTISYYLPSGGDASLVVYDLLGKEVKTLFKGYASAGKQSVQWNGINNEGKQVSSGVYIYSLRSGSKILNNKMLLVK